MINSIAGILFAPFIHKDIQHLISNTIPLLLTSTIISFYFFRIKNIIFFICYLLPGIFVWFIGRPSYHIGASGMLYAHLFFILTFGLLTRTKQYIVFSAIIILFYGSIFWGIFPTKESISWESHLGGALTGILLAIYFRKIKNIEYKVPAQNQSIISTTFNNDNIKYIVIHKKREEPQI